VRWLFLFVTPPLNITESELRQGVAIIDEVLDFVDQQTDN
jgi:4-aminobutyrate aminotransferase-like enzyme